jgi:hypothetical protein
MTVAKKDHYGIFSYFGTKVLRKQYSNPKYKETN